MRVRDTRAPGHVRTPGYLQGKRGVIERVQGAFRNPETLAYGGDGMPTQPLYMVQFEQAELWPRYPAATSDKLFADIYEPWLEPS